MINSSRRTFLGASALLPLAATGGRAASPAGKTIEADLLRYVRFGNKRAGGPGDMACGEWLAGELESAGYAVERQSFAVPYFEATAAELVSERSEEHTSELQSLMRISYAVFCLQKKNTIHIHILH